LDDELDKQSKKYLKILLFTKKEMTFKEYSQIKEKIMNENNVKSITDLKDEQILIEQLS